MKPISCTLLLLALAGSTALAATATFDPVADTTISEDNLAKGTGATDFMMVGHLDPGHANVPSRGLLKFDLSTIPAGMVATSVTLKVAVIVESTAGPHLHTLNRVLTAWTEADANWTSAGPGPWSESGGDFNWIEDAALNIDGLGYHTFSSTPALVATVNTWLTNASENLGWLLRSNEEFDGRNARRLTTREALSFRPELTVNYTAAPPPPPPPPPPDFTVTSPGFSYTINGAENNPGLTLMRGRTYAFAIDADPSHPFEIVSDLLGTPYNDGVTNNNISSGTITFSVPANAPAQLFYICSLHFFGGAIDIIDPPPPVRILSVDVGGAGVVMKSLGTNGNGWVFAPEFSSNLFLGSWSVVPAFTNQFVGGTNITTFPRLDPICGPNVFLRVKNVKN